MSLVNDEPAFKCVDYTCVDSPPFSLSNLLIPWQSSVFNTETSGSSLKACPEMVWDTDLAPFAFGWRIILCSADWIIEGFLFPIKSFKNQMAAKAS